MILIEENEGMDFGLIFYYKGERGVKIKMFFASIKSLLAGQRVYNKVFARSSSWFFSFG